MFANFLKFKKHRTGNLQVGSRSVPLLFVHHPKARRYLLRLRSDGVARITVPGRGSIKVAREFASRNIDWLDRQFQLQADRPKTPACWGLGTDIHFRGELVRIQSEGADILVGAERIKVPGSADFRPAIQKHLLKLAQNEFPGRVLELARIHAVDVRRVSVRNQKTRWGSCSGKGTISLNWRLIQAPGFVGDYVILHELAHRKQMNHKDEFWLEVGRLCPDYLLAEGWLKLNQKLLR